MIITEITRTSPCSSGHVEYSLKKNRPQVFHENGTQTGFGHVIDFCIMTSLNTGHVTSPIQ